MAGSLSGLSTETVDTVTLEAKDYNLLKVVVPNLSKIVDSCSGNSTLAPVTAAFSSYSDLFRFLHQIRIG